MEGTILNFRRSRHVQHNNQMIVKFNNVNTREEAKKLVGKKVTFKTETGKEIHGIITSPHGNSGAVRVLFEKGMPGQAITEKVNVQ
ncbi:MAG: 50S ribosomal protein L35ae [Candidatus Woesearchaeota archaeon]